MKFTPDIGLGLSLIYSAVICGRKFFYFLFLKNFDLKYIIFPDIDISFVAFKSDSLKIYVSLILWCFTCRCYGDEDFFL